MSPYLPNLPSRHPVTWMRALPTQRMAPAGIDKPETFFWRFRGGRLAFVAEAIGEGGFERGNAFVQALVVHARLLRHRLDSVDLLVLHDIGGIEKALRLVATDDFDLL